MSESKTEILPRKNRVAIAYCRRAAKAKNKKGLATGPDGARPGLVFLGGFASDMTGSKALYLDGYAARRGLAFLRFDYSGHGQSEGRFEDGTIGAWAQDALDAFEALTQGPQILVGSSMGGWIMLLLALARPQRVAGLVGIAAAPDFTQDLIWEKISAEEKVALARDGFFREPSAYDEAGLIITQKLIEEGRDHLLLRGPITITAPMRLLHGMNDTAVPWETAPRLALKVASEDVEVQLIKDGDHRLSRPEDLTRLSLVLDQLIP